MFKSLVTGVGCSADGTSSTQNPLAKLVSKILGVTLEEACHITNTIPKTRQEYLINKGPNLKLHDIWANSTDPTLENVWQQQRQQQRQQQQSTFDNVWQQSVQNNYIVKTLSSINPTTLKYIMNQNDSYIDMYRSGDIGQMVKLIINYVNSNSDVHLGVIRGVNGKNRVFFDKDDPVEPVERHFESGELIVKKFVQNQIIKKGGTLELYMGGGNFAIFSYNLRAKEFILTVVKPKFYMNSINGKVANTETLSQGTFDIIGSNIDLDELKQIAKQKHASAKLFGHKSKSRKSRKSRKYRKSRKTRKTRKSRKY